MTKSELIGVLAADTGITRREMTAVLERLREVAIEELRSGNAFVLPGMVRFSVAHRKARSGRNVRTGAPIEIPARDVVRCKASKSFEVDTCG